MVELSEPMPMVRTSSGHFVPWDRKAIVKSLLKETRLAEKFFSVRAMTREEAEAIAVEVEAKIRRMGLKFISGPLIREVVNIVLLEKGSENPVYRIYRNIYTRVGAPVFDAYEIDVGRGFEARENANLQPNAETAHKKKADKMSKEEYLLLMPLELADAHLRGDIHIHDLEYFGTRPFCQDWDLRYFFYYGFMPDGMGIKTSVARAAQRPEVAVLHSVKILAAAQTNFAGGEGFYNYLVFLAPYMRGLNYRHIKQLMQMMFFELSVDGVEFMLVENSGELKLVKTGDYIDRILNRGVDEVRGLSEIKYNPGFKVFCYDPLDGCVKLVDATAVVRHPISDGLYLLRTRSGRRVRVTGFHSVFTLDENGFLKPCMVKDLKPGDWVITLGSPHGLKSTGVKELNLIELMLEKLGAEEVEGFRVVVDDRFIEEHREAVRNAAIGCGFTTKAVEGWLRRKRIPLKVFRKLNLSLEEARRLHLASVFHREPLLPAVVRLDGDLAELLGYYVSEGCVSRSRLELGVNIAAFSMEVRERIVDLVEKVFRLKPFIHGDTVRFGGSLYSLLFAKVFGCGFSAHDKQVPPVMFEASVNEVVRFLYAYHVGDGFTYRDRVGFDTVSEGLVNGLILLLQMLGLRPLVRERVRKTDFTSKPEKIFRVLILGRKDLSKILSLIPDIKDGFKLRGLGRPGREIKRRIPLFKALRAALKRRRYGNAYNPRIRSVTVDTVRKLLGEEAYEIGDLKPILDGSLVAEELVEVKEIAPSSRYVYDIEVLGIENFTGGLGFFLLHNTQMYIARGGQPVFSNIQITPGVPEIWRDVPVVARGRVGPDKYGDYEDEVRMLYRAVNEVALEGDYWGKPFNFPKLENGITPDMFNPRYEEEWLLAHKLVAKFGSPYFDNMMPEYRGYGKGVSCYQCCAYSFVDTPDSDPEFEDKLYFVGGKHFSMGSWQVVTINLPRAAYRARGDDTALFEEVRRLMGLCVEVFKTKHRWMRLMIENNRIPFATQRPRDPVTGEPGPPPVNFDELVWTIGIVGANEMAQYHTGYQLHESDEAVRLVVRLLLEMKRYLKELEEKHGLKLALARTPAESCAQRLAVCDLIDPEFRDAARKVVKGELEAGERLISLGDRDAPVYYSNGTHVYVGARIPLLEKLRIENKFFPILSGGNMFHVWLGQADPDPESLYKFTKRIATQSQIGYFAYTKDLTICEDCNRVSGGLNAYCPSCGSTNVRWWSRVTGYYQEVKGWNRAKRQEFFDRYRVSIP